jgi:DNA-binding HxlR family transcriptional regulator
MKLICKQKRQYRELAYKYKLTEFGRAVVSAMKRLFTDLTDVAGF